MLDILFPNTCPSCLGSLHKSEKVCRTCYDAIKYVAKWSFCRKCGFPFGFFSEGNEEDSPNGIKQQGSMCSRCIRDFYSFEKARSIAIYEGNIRDLLISFKYEGKLNR